MFSESFWLFYLCKCSYPYILPLNALKATKYYTYIMLVHCTEDTHTKLFYWIFARAMIAKLDQMSYCFGDLQDSDDFIQSVVTLTIPSHETPT